MCTKFIFLLVISNCNSFLIDCQTDIDCIHLNTFGRHKCFVKKCQSVDYLLEMNLKGGGGYEEDTSPPPMFIGEDYLLEMNFTDERFPDSGKREYCNF